MTTPSTSAQGPAAGWRYSINHGPDGEENFANVYAADGQFVGNLRTHHAVAICNAFAVCEKLASAPAPASGRVDAGRVTLFSALEAAYIRGAAWCAEMGMTHTFSELRKAAYDYADKEEKDVICREVRASLSPAATPVQTANCCHCGRIIDTREMARKTRLADAHSKNPPEAEHG